MPKRASIVALALAGLSVAAFATEVSKPNILLIVADDLGYGELGVQGYSKEIPTPNIDSIAHEGTRFTSGYVSGPYCSPTRAGLLTGRYQQRFGHEFNPGPAETAADKVGLDLNQKTLGDRFQAAGYTSAWIGKSHLGYDPEFHPLRRGFDHFFGFLGGAHDYLDSDGRGRDPIQRDGTPVGKADYLTEEIGRDAATFIEQNKGKPWVTYLAFNAVHAPLEAPEKYLARFPQITDPKRQKFAGLLSGLDDAVGVVLEKLRSTGQEENTLIFFISDNGGPTPQTTSNNGPLRGYKAQTWEGGIRVAWFVKWKGHLPEGKTDDRPVIQLDVLPTALAAAHIEPQPDWKLEGVNLLPYIQGEKTEPPHEALFWRFGQQLAVRQGDWKLVKAPGGGTQLGSLVGKATLEGAELYNLKQDIGEKTNLANQEPEKVKQLAAAWSKWNEQNVAPKWLPGARKAVNLAKEDKSASAPAAPAATAPAAAVPAAAKPANTAATTKPAATGPWKKGDTVSADEAPQIANQPLTLAAKIEPSSPNGVILALGAQGNGVSLFLQEGKLAFALRSKRQLTTVFAHAALSPGAHQVEARLAQEGKITLLVDGQPAGEGKAPELVAAQPREGLTVGNDGKSSVGEYTAPNDFAGNIENATLQPLR